MNRTYCNTCYKISRAVTNYRKFALLNDVKILLSGKCQNKYLFFFFFGGKVIVMWISRRFFIIPLDCIGMVAKLRDCDPLKRGRIRLDFCYKSKKVNISDL